ncbi:MAG: 3-dehydroquinate synthase [Myxococcota bacterium]|nr:3-dehydroquinate synthase [Myxococcota bacterium]
MRTVVLSGFMGTGKSTLGPALAARLGVPFVDTDSELERATGQPIRDLWRAEGEEAFRAREEALVERILSGSEPKVIAFGGGTVTIERARRLAIDRSLVVTLTAPADAILERIPDRDARPKLGANDTAARVRELLKQRSEAYGECHLALSTATLDVDRSVESVLALVARDPLLVPLGTRSYVIDICDGEQARLTDAIARRAPSSLVLVTDSHVQRARGAAIDAALRPLALKVARVTLPPGEQHKTLATVATIWEAALGAGADRDALVLAVGGGVVGDLAGFAAACLLRGVSFLPVPTTLLSMVDASVGGKTGFDLPSGKNLVGAFHQPCAVVADLAHLETLPARDRAAGLAEVVKIALATDAALFALLEREAASLAAGDHAALAPVVRAAVAAKIRVVCDDEREAGNRALLNLGHTVGHALEVHGGYSRWLHGEAVALGLLAELEATVKLRGTPPALVARVAALLEALGLPTRIDRRELAASWKHVALDKKRAGDGVRLPIVTGLGSAAVERVTLTDLRSAVIEG